jgi:hypothetical protein
VVSVASMRECLAQDALKVGAEPLVPAMEPAV